MVLRAILYQLMADPELESSRPAGPALSVGSGLLKLRQQIHFECLKKTVAAFGMDIDQRVALARFARIGDLTKS